MYYERQVLIDRIKAQPTAYDPEKLAEWLEDYKRLKNIPEHNYYNCHNLTCRRKCEKPKGVMKGEID